MGVNVNSLLVKNILPKKDNEVNIGASDNRFENLYCNNGEFKSLSVINDNTLARADIYTMSSGGTVCMALGDGARDTVGMYYDITTDIAKLYVDSEPVDDSDVPNYGFIKNNFAPIYTGGWQNSIGKGIPEGDANNATLGGLYYCYNGVSNLPTYTNDFLDYSRLLVLPRDSTDIIQILFNNVVASRNIMCIRNCYNGTWHDWEYINPPMIPGTIYRTIERYNGQPVYSLCIYVGQLASAGTTKAIDLTSYGWEFNNTRIISFQAVSNIASDTNVQVGLMLPHTDTSGTNTGIDINIVNNVLNIHSASGASRTGYDAYITIKYITR